MPKITPECHLRTRSVLLPLWLDTHSFPQPVVGAHSILFHIIPLANHFRYTMWFSNHSILYALFYPKLLKKRCPKIIFFWYPHSSMTIVISAKESIIPYIQWSESKKMFKHSCGRHMLAKWTAFSSKSSLKVCLYILHTYTSPSGDQCDGETFEARRG